MSNTDWRAITERLAARLRVHASSTSAGYRQDPQEIDDPYAPTEPGMSDRWCAYDQYALMDYENAEVMPRDFSGFGGEIDKNLIRKVVAQRRVERTMTDENGNDYVTGWSSRPTDEHFVCIRCGKEDNWSWASGWCYECDQWYCYNCGNDLECPDHLR